MTGEEMGEETQHEEKRRQAVAVGRNGCVGRGAEEEFLPCIAGLK